MRKRVVWIVAASFALALVGQVVLDDVFPNNSVYLLISETAASQAAAPKRHAGGALFEARRSSVRRASRVIASEGGPHPYYLRGHR